MPQQSIVDYRPFQTEGEGLGLSAYGKKRLAAENRQKVMSSVRALSYMAAIVIPLFAILDYFMYPNHFVKFLILRFVCVGMVLGALFVCARTRFGKGYYRLFTVIIPLIPAFFIALMIFLSADAHTTYYVGMVLCLVVIGFVSHWTCVEALVASALVILFYFIAIFPSVFGGVDTRGSIYLLSNCIFAVAYGAVITIGTYLHQKIRMNEFVSRENVRHQQVKLEIKNSELARTMSELRETEDQLIQSEKMASLGQLSAGVIHEIGNPLNYSNQALFLLRKRLKRIEQDDQINEAVDDIQDSIDRMKDIVKELREFSHKSSEIKFCYPVEESVNSAIRVLGREIEDSRTEVILDIDPYALVEGVKNQLTQVFINLIHNAIQAMESGTPDRRHQIHIGVGTSGNDVAISVRDNGPGISDELRAKVFDPFFTTKEVGEGTGLGLSISFKIVEAHGGQLKVVSQPDEFTEFLITFPSSEECQNQSHHDLDSAKLDKNPTQFDYHENSVL